MKIAVILSGSIREPENSLHSLSLLKDHTIYVFIHTWRNVKEIQQKDSYSRRPNVEPDAQLMQRYKPTYSMIENWEFTKTKFQDNLAAWQATSSWGSRPEHETNLGVQGMYYSLERAAKLLVEPILDYDMLIRMRFDCRLIDNPLDLPVRYGWNVPADNDYFGINDQLGWFVPYPGDDTSCKREAAAYFGVWSQMDELIRAGCSYCPETLLKASFTKCGAPVNRVKLDYTIRY